METKEVVIILNAPLGIEFDFNEQINAFTNAIKTANLKSVILKDEEVLDYFAKNARNVQFVIFWNKDIYLAKYLESINVKVFNSSEAISICDDKALTYAKLLSNNIATPKTFVLPYTYGYDLVKKYPNIEEIIISKGFSYPFVLKQRVGSFGNEVYLINNKDELMNKLNELKGKNLLVQEYIEEFKGIDYRVNVINDKAVSIIKRVNNSGFKSNIHQGGYMEEVINPRKDILDIAIKASEACNCSFSGVDVVVDKNDKPMILEVNSNARTVAVTKINHIDIAKLIINYLIEITK